MRGAVRFYRTVTIDERGGAYLLRLDDKPIRTPQKAVLAVSSRALAEAVADEWREQGRTIDPQSMPITKLSYAAIDVGTAHAARLREEILAYGKSDLLCYRAEGPETLISRQQEAWDPLLDWAVQRFDARLRAVTGVVFREQPPESLKALARALENRSAYELVALHSAVSIMGSLVLALALLEGRLDAGQAFALSRLDEAFQAEAWGRDAEAEARAGALALELQAIENFLRLARP